MRQSSYWEVGNLPPATPPRPLPARVDVLIVGAGFMGRWLAYFLGKLRPQLSVLVLERDQFSYGASSRNAGFLTCGQVSEMLADEAEHGRARVLEVFEQRSRGIALALAEFPQLAIDPCGSTDHDELTDAGRELMQALNERAGEALYTEREVNLGGRRRTASFNRADAGVHPVKLLRLLRESSQADFRFGVRVESVRGGECRAHDEQGEHVVRYGRAFVCVNAYAARLAACDVVPGRGQVIVTSPVQTVTDRTLGYLHGGYDYFRFVDGRLLLGGGRNLFRAQEQTDEIATTPHVLAHLKALAARILGHNKFTVDYHWAGIMGFRGGAHLGGSPRQKLDASTELVAGFGGMGVALAPAYAHEVAQEC